MSQCTLDVLVDQFLARGGVAIYVSEQRVQLGPTPGACVDLLLDCEAERPITAKVGRRGTDIAEIEYKLVDMTNLLATKPRAAPFVLFWGSEEVHGAWSANYSRRDACGAALQVIDSRLLVLR